MTLPCVELLLLLCWPRLTVIPLPLRGFLPVVNRGSQRFLIRSHWHWWRSDSPHVDGRSLLLTRGVVRRCRLVKDLKVVQLLNGLVLEEIVDGFSLGCIRNVGHERGQHIRLLLV